VDDSSLRLDTEALTATVRVALGRLEATVESWQVQPLRGLGFGAAIHRVSGVASQGGVRLPWSVIRKHVRDAGDGPAAFSYWRREPLAYACGLLAGLAGVAAPRCLAQSEEADGVVLWLEDLADRDGGWTVERYGVVARDLGLLGGAHAGGRPVPDWPWLSRGFLASWAEQGAAGLEVFAEAVRDPLLARLYPPEVAAVMVELWQARGRICAILAGWPQVLSHLDATPANVIVRGRRAYLIDWAFVGRAALGEELAPLVAGSPLFGGLPAEHLAVIDRVAFPAYLEGLGAAGWVGDPTRVRFAYCAAAALRFCPRADDVAGARHQPGRQQRRCGRAAEPRAARAVRELLRTPVRRGAAGARGELPLPGDQPGGGGARTAAPLQRVLKHPRGPKTGSGSDDQPGAHMPAQATS
jgi:hypothetical protein